MQVISVNIGQTETIKWQGQNVKTGIFKKPVKHPISLSTTDVEGDKVIDRRYHGGEDKACYLFSADVYDQWKALYPKLVWDWGMFGENVTLAGMDEQNLMIGDIYRLGTALVQITQPRQPCYKLGVRLGSQLAVKMFVEKQQPGAYLRVLETGTVGQADTMKLVERLQTQWSVKEVFRLLYHAKQNTSAIEQVVTMPFLADSCRTDLLKNAGL